MAPRASWKGFLKIAELGCPVALYTAISTAERIAFHTVNRASGHRVHRRFVDAETGDPVERDDQVKGYEVGEGDYVVLEPDEIAAAVPHSDKTLTVAAFVPCAAVDEVFLDKPYYLVPADRAADEVFTLIREGLRARKAAAVAHAVLFRRARTLLVWPHGEGLVATVLAFDHEVRPASAAFDGVPALAITGEMLALAKHIIATKTGSFDPAGFEDRYEAALAEMVKAKLEGRPLAPRREARREAPVDLLAALRQSAGASAPPEAGRAPAPRASRSKAPKAKDKADRKTARPGARKPAARRKAG